jgi:OmpA-OmpF porin, OOP family
MAALIWPMQALGMILGAVAIDALTVPAGPSTSKPGTAQNIFFASGSVVLEGPAEAILRVVADTMMRTGDLRLQLIGSADRVGSAGFNRWLSRRRAEAVRNRLVELGVPLHRMFIIAQGEDNPLVPTEDGAPEPLNRSVTLIAF